MCKAFSGVATRTKVYWKFAMDGHEDIKEYFKLKDDSDKMVPFEITPKNNDYIRPDEWVFKFDEGCPDWWKQSHESMCWSAWKQWKRKLDATLKKIYIDKPIIHPFKVKPPKHIEPKHIKLLKKWASVGDSVWDSVRVSVGDSVRVSVRASVGDSVGDSVRVSIWDSVWDSVGAYTGSFFKLKKWKYVKHKPWEYPFKPAVQLWEMGLVPSFDGTVWRLHGGKKAKVLFKITDTDLKNWKEADKG